MLQSKTARLLSTFDKKEYPVIERYLETASRGPTETMRAIFRHLCRHAGRKGKDSDDEKFIQEAFGWGKNDPQTASKVNFALHQLKLSLEDYLLHDHYKQHELAREKALLEAFRHRKASEFVLESSARIDKLIEPMGKGPTYYDAEAELINVQFNHPYPNQYARRKYDIQDVIRSFERTHLSLALVHNWNLLLQPLHLTQLDEHTRRSIQQVLNAVAGDPEFAAEPFQLAYTIAVRSLADKQLSLSTFQAIRAAAGRLLGHAPAHEVMGLMNLQINYLILLQNASASDYSEVLLELYDLGLENGGLFKDGYLSYGDFMNMINLSAKIKRLVWAKGVIDRFGDRLNPEVREQVLPLARARIAYFEGDPAQALRLLNPQRKALNDPDKVLEKLLRSYCYYELGQDDLLEAHLEAFRKFILRHKTLVASMRRPSGEFIRILRRLMGANDRGTLQEIQAELATSPAIYPFEWLSAKVQERLDRLS
jgi:hypothetical protein